MRELVLAIVTLVLCLSTLVSSTVSGVARASDIERLEDQATVVLQQASLLNFKDYETINTDVYAKNSLLQYNDANKLVDEETIQDLKIYLEQKDDYFYYLNIFSNATDSFKTSSTSFRNLLTDLFVPSKESSSHSSLDSSHIEASSYSPILSISSKDQFEYYDGDGGGGSEENNNSSEQSNDEKMPTLPYDEPLATVNINNPIDGITFVGLSFTPDACIAVFNFFSWFVNQSKNIYDIYPSFDMATIGIASNYLGGIINEFIGIISGSFGVVGMIIS